jgi:hypothetical protein
MSAASPATGTIDTPWKLLCQRDDDLDSVQGSHQPPSPVNGGQSVRQWAAIVLPLGTVNAAKENVYIVGSASKPSQYLWRCGNGRPMMQMAKWAARIGAVLYILWGAFHLVAANAVYALAEQSTSMVRARLLQDAFYLLFFAVAGILMAVILNWRNDKQGYWMNGTLI